MAKEAQSSGLQVEEDRPWQETLWTTQRVAWVVMALIVAAALVGLTGNGGPLSSATARSGGATIHYPQITRWEADDKLTVRLPPSASGKLDIELSRSFGESFAVRSVQPEPSEIAATASGQRFTFDVADGGEKVVIFHFRPTEPAFGRTVQLRVAQAPPARLVITVLP